MVPQTLTSLEGLSTSVAVVGPQFRVGSEVGSHGGRVLEELVAHATLLVHLAGVHVQMVLLEVVAFLEANAADGTLVGPFVRVCSNVVLVVGVLSKRLHADLAGPTGRLSTPFALVLFDGRNSLIQKIFHFQKLVVTRCVVHAALAEGWPWRGLLLVQRHMHAEVFLTAELLAA